MTVDRLRFLREVAVVIALVGASAAYSDERWLLRGVFDGDLRNTDASSAILSRDDSEPVPGGDLQLWFAADLHARVQTVVVGRLRDEADSAFEQAYVRTTLGSTRRVFIDVGRLRSNLGNFSSRYLSSMNPLVGRPPGYSVSYPLGVRVSGALGRLDYRVAMVDEPLINDRLLPRPGSDLRPAVSIGITPVRGLRFGVYGTRGAYLNPGLEPFIGNGRSWRDFGQRVLGLDAHFSRRYFEVNADYNRNRYEVPSFDSPFRGSGGFVELKYVVRPRWFVALRGSRNAYVKVQEPTGTAWTALRSRFDDLEFGGAFRASKGLLVKLSYRETSWERAAYPKGDSLAAQVSYSFDLREVADRLH